MLDLIDCSDRGQGSASPYKHSGQYLTSDRYPHQRHLFLQELLSVYYWHLLRCSTWLEFSESTEPAAERLFQYLCTELRRMAGPVDPRPPPPTPSPLLSFLPAVDKLISKSASRHSKIAEVIALLDQQLLPVNADAASAEFYRTHWESGNVVRFLEKLIYFKCRVSDADRWRWFGLQVVQALTTARDANRIDEGQVLAHISQKYCKSPVYANQPLSVALAAIKDDESALFSINVPSLPPRSHFRGPEQRGERERHRRTAEVNQGEAYDSELDFSDYEEEARQANSLGNDFPPSTDPPPSTSGGGGDRRGGRFQISFPFQIEHWFEAGVFPASVGPYPGILRRGLTCPLCSADKNFKATKEYTRKEYTAKFPGALPRRSDTVRPLQEDEILVHPLHTCPRAAPYAQKFVEANPSMSHLLQPLERERYNLLFKRNNDDNVRLFQEGKAAKVFA